MLRGDRLDALRRSMAAALMLLGGVFLGWCGFEWMQARAYQREQAAVLERAPAAGPPAAPTSPVSAGDAIGILRIPRLGVSTVVAEGDDARTLKKAIGHLPDTPMPWQDGNSALAAHRDTFFRPLAHVKIGDELRFTTPAHGELLYRVRGTLVVRPEDVWVLDPRPAPTLTLITCYPFNFVGPAPRRFVVQAERVAGQ